MPKVKSSKRGGKPPEGYTKIEPTISKLVQKLKDAQTQTEKHSVWKIIQINHQISRYVYTMHYNRKLIDKPLYEWLLKQKYVDANLIAKWKKQGYEKLCCLNCIRKEDNNFGSSCICRVPKQDLSDDKPVECVKCGCKGCSSTD
ncbi:Component of the SF3b subcomplex of the U2 snRNP [Yamadazyma tenuis]|uniref:G10 protein n=1 Tax=Candida tenuis (strain ATCC 10573 / BCRC 21748 / CBS 615 / JCM 9827 / NBRC 10315 / NRRL Y-1498 / VKM Y-70) TaxID=590646 RepID=G3BET2_CANTC|nr:G10 protein [Yamadazyma tenuis ATCC 10573]EGV60588.1 G10 protein [Yamadazyma tenuis ATCC 10573]WEJ94166.1 Component of the SF3b subcomplex of the U2 snRNP [Yamadazyma tenuis]